MKDLNKIDSTALKTVTGGAAASSWGNNWAAKSDWAAAPTAAKAPSTSWNTGSWNCASSSR